MLIHGEPIGISRSTPSVATRLLAAATTSFGNNNDFDLQRELVVLPARAVLLADRIGKHPNQSGVLHLVPAELTADWPRGTDVIANDTTQYQANQD